MPYWTCAVRTTEFFLVTREMRRQVSALRRQVSATAAAALAVVAAGSVAVACSGAGGTAGGAPSSDGIVSALPAVAAYLGGLLQGRG